MINQEKSQRLEENKLKELCECNSMDSLDYKGFVELIEREASIGQYSPEPVVQIDPRSNERIVYNSRRANRPHDNRPHDSSPQLKPEARLQSSCVICDGKSTGIIDLQPLSEPGTYTFINKNLFPVFYPGNDAGSSYPMDPHSLVSGSLVTGMHFLQWTSNVHSKDWHNMAQEDSIIAVKALARLEKALLYSKGPLNSNTDWSGKEGDPTSGFVSIIKNFGRLVGGSLEHGHQQIAYTNIMPGKFRNNLHFFQREGIPYSAWILANNPEHLTVREFDTGTMVVPYYMRRPYDMQFLFHDSSKQYLHELNDNEIADLARVFRLATSSMMKILPAMGRETAYNFVVHNGPGAGIYVEFLPYTQEYGGYEHAGIYLCQGSPRDVAEDLFEYFKG